LPDVGIECQGLHLPLKQRAERSIQVGGRAHAEGRRPASTPSLSRPPPGAPSGEDSAGTSSGTRRRSVASLQADPRAVHRGT
jgi:hypothetical protein